MIALYSQRHKEHASMLRVMGGWCRLTYWGVMGPVLMAERLLAHDYLQQCTLWQKLLAR